MLFLFVFFGSDNAALKLTELSASIAAGQTKKYVNIFFFLQKNLNTIELIIVCTAYSKKKCLPTWEVERRFIWFDPKAEHSGGRIRNTKTSF